MKSRLSGLAIGVAVFVAGAGVAGAQTTLVCDLENRIIVCPATGSPRAQLQAATFIAGSEPTGATLAQAVALEVATAPLGSSSGGFVYSFDPATRGFRRTSATFGPAFAERAMTIGRGKFSGGLNFIHRSYDEFGGLDLGNFDVFEFQGGSQLAARSADVELKVKTDTVAAFGHFGLHDKLDFGVLIPWVNLSLSGTSRIFVDPENELQRVLLGTTTSGLGDVALFSKYRIKTFGADPSAGAGTRGGALAATATVRLPTGDEEKLLGLGIGRAMLSLVGSASMGRWSPHANVGYELWTSRVEVPRDFQGTSTLSAKDQVHYAAGVEVEMTRRFTLIGDVLGRYLRGSGQVDYQLYQFRPNPQQIQGADALVADPNGVHSVFLIPGAKWNFFRNGLLSVNVIVPVTKGGLRDRVTPVVGIDWGF